MKQVVLLSKDTKILREMGRWLKELSDDTMVEAIGDISEFQRRFCGLIVDQSAGEAELRAVSGSDVVSNLSTITNQKSFIVNLLVVDLESLAEDPIRWIVETKAHLMRNGYSTIKEPTNVLFIGFSDAANDVDKYRHEAIDDLILKPVDKDLFLQKSEIYLADDGAVRASFLFQQKTEMIIEMGKDIRIDSVSEYGFAIRNPTPLASGVFARVYCDVFGTGTTSGLFARVYRVERHPTEAGLFLCYFTYHGITQTQLANVRKFLRAEKPNPTRLGGIKYPAIGGPNKSVVVVDMNADAREIVRDALKSNFQNVTVHQFSSYVSFLKVCAKRAVEGNPAHQDSYSASGADDKALRLTLAGASEISFLVNAVSAELISIEPDPKKGARILDVSAQDLAGGGNRWLSLFSNDNRNEIEEFLAYLRSGQSGEIGVVGRAPTGGTVRIRIRGRIEKSGEADGVTIARLVFREMVDDDKGDSAGTFASSRNSKEMQAIDCIFIDGSLLGDIPEQSITTLTDHLQKGGLIQGPDWLSIVIMGDERSRVLPGDFRLKTVQDFIYKPIDRKMFLGKAMVVIDGLMPINDSVDLSHTPARSTGRLTKEVMMSEISEFGIQIRLENPFRERTFIRFFSPVFLDETGLGLLGRCRSSRKDKESGLFNCFFSFFGVTDAQLKHIRNWIRGDYAARKEKAGR